MARPATPHPRLGAALRLRCPYCAVTPLRSAGSWFTFQRGCVPCDYRFEREIGYYTGASWMITFPVVAATAFVMAALLMAFAGGLDTLVIVALSSLSMVVLGVVITPFCMALWLVLEHRLHPLGNEDTIDKELVN